ncbi:MAG: hypothetical protein EZS28_040836 [Streblomastix strix]|uniref:Uncharacterized protein n=1 Tax=Streblomastix strix TaxID=222440 RepID=A0A5J4TYU2_9EUKA|nr:MAG: hypothetical protein EZS28_040836 [Streblomastix strix]
MGKFRRIGIVDVNKDIPNDYNIGMDEFSLSYDGSSGQITHSGQFICKNDLFINDDIVTLEVYLPPLETILLNQQHQKDSNISTTTITSYRNGELNFKTPTLSFKVKDKTQVNCLEGIPEAFRFCV